MLIILIIIGIGIGILSGFFGIGGGTLLVPILLLLGFSFKTAVGISITQMVFSSVYGSYLNVKRGSLQLGEGLFVGIGGFVGGFLSGYILQHVPDIALQVTFISFVIFAIYRMAVTEVIEEHTSNKSLPRAFLFAIGVAIGMIAISIGVGGAIILIPLLSGLLHYPVKKSVSAGLFFVVFSSIAGLISGLVNGHIDIYHGIIVGVGSLVGVWVGIRLKERVTSHRHRNFIVVMYSVILIIMLYKMVS